MKKVFFIGLASATLIGAVHIHDSFAQTSETSPPAQAVRAEPPDNQIVNEVDARIARLKANLQLTPDQEKNWSGLQTALHDYGVGQFKTLTAGRSVYQDREGQRLRNERPNDIIQMRDQATELTSRAASLTKLANAAEPLYNNLDNHQKHTLIRFMKTEFEGRHPRSFMPAL
ncbi:Spy/CpxP family protein refolding chaperone [Beijerinckia indica]|nr:Spy/CpxP family protein refolding chaperone [Beijerinckia indica]